MNRKPQAILLIALASAMLCAGALLTVERAAAVWLDVTTDQSLAGHLVLESLPEHPQWADMRPGDTAHWQITAALEDVDAGNLELEFHATGELIDLGALSVEVVACAEPFDVGVAIEHRISPGAPSPTAPACAGFASVVQSLTPLAEVARNLGGGVFGLEVLQQGVPRYLLVSLVLSEVPGGAGAASASATSASAAPAAATIGIGLHATGDQATMPSNPTPTDSKLRDPISGGGATLAPTGSDAVALGLLAAGLIGLALGVGILRSVRATPIEREAAVSRAPGERAVG